MVVPFEGRTVHKGAFLERSSHWTWRHKQAAAPLSPATPFRNETAQDAPRRAAISGA